ELDRGAGLGGAADRRAIGVRRRGRADRERGRRGRRRRVLDVANAARARRDVAGRVGRGRIEGRGAVVADRDRQPGRGESGRTAGGGDGARARRVGVEFDRRARLGAAADLREVVVRWGRGRGGERGGGERSGRV